VALPNTIANINTLQHPRDFLGTITDGGGQEGREGRTVGTIPCLSPKADLTSRCVHPLCAFVLILNSPCPTLLKTCATMFARKQGG